MPHPHPLAFHLRASAKSADKLLSFSTAWINAMMYPNWNAHAWVTRLETPSGAVSSGWRGAWSGMSMYG